MPSDRGQRYDSFVIRLWQEEVTGRLLRAEVDHVQSGAVYVARDIGLAWVQDTLDRALGIGPGDDPQRAPPPPRDG